MASPGTLLKHMITGGARMLNRILGPCWLRYAPARLRHVNRVLADEGDTTVVGGVYTLATVLGWSRVVGDAGRVILIEANPHSVEALRKGLGETKNVSLISRAIWDRKCKVQFTVSTTNYQGWARVKDDTVSKYPVQLDETAHDIEVDADSIDNIVAGLNIDKVDLIYLTINDAQLKAVGGIGRILAKNRQCKIAIHSATPYPANETAKKLRELGMKVSVKKFIKKLKRTDKDEIVSIYACR